MRKLFSINTNGKLWSSVEMTASALAFRLKCAFRAGCMSVGRLSVACLKDMCTIKASASAPGCWSLHADVGRRLLLMLHWHRPPLCTIRWAVRLFEAHPGVPDLQVLAEADLQPLVSEAFVGNGAAFAPATAAAAAAITSAANSAASSPSAVIGIAAAGNAASTWGSAGAAAQPQALQMMVQTVLQPTAAAAAATAALPNAYAPYGSLPPLPFRMSSGSFGSAGAFAACLQPPYFTPGGGGGGSMAATSGYGAQQQGSSPMAAALQGGPPRFACISAPAVCMGTKMALADAVQYEAQHALMLEDLRGRPVGTLHTVPDVPWL